VKNAGVENAGVDSRGGKCRSGKSRSDNVWKAVKQKIQISLTFFIKSGSTGRPLVSSTTELTGLIPGAGVLLFEADSESDSDSGQEPGLRVLARSLSLTRSLVPDSGGLRLHTPECMDSRLSRLCSSH